MAHKVERQKWDRGLELGHTFWLVLFQREARIHPSAHAVDGTMRSIVSTPATLSAWRTAFYGYRVSSSLVSLVRALSGRQVVLQLMDGSLSTVGLQDPDGIGGRCITSTGIMGPVTSLAQATTVLCMPRTGPSGPLPRDAIHRCAMRWIDSCSDVPFAPFSQVELRLSARSQSSPEGRATRQTMRPSCLRVPMDDGVQVASKGRMRCAHRPSSMTLARTLSPPRPIHVWMRWRKKRWSTTKTRCDRKKDGELRWPNQRPSQPSRD